MQSVAPRGFVAALGLISLLAGSAFGQATSSWPQFLGPGGLAKGQGAKTLSFDREQDLRFAVDIPAGASSPCIHSGKVFLTGMAGDQQCMFALDAKTGKELWRHAEKAPKHQDYKHKDGGVALPTACANEKRVFFYLPSVGLIARTHDGKFVWEHELPAPKGQFGFGSSPILVDGKVILMRDGCPDRKLYAFDEATGEQVWTERRAPFFESHATPFVWKNAKRTELIVASTGRVMSFDPANGKKLWQVKGLTPLVCTTPTASVDRLYFAGWSTISATGIDRLLDGMKNPVDLTEAERKDPKVLFARFDKNKDGKLSKEEAPAGRAQDAWGFFDQDKSGFVTINEFVPMFKMPTQGKNLLVAIKPGGSGDVTKTHVEWSERRGIPYVSSPLLYDGRVYLVKAGGILSCFDAVTGKPRFRRSRLGDRSEYYATPVGIDGHVVVCSSAGTLFVLEAADELKIVRTVDFGEPLFASPAFVDGIAYVRTRSKLYAFGK